MAFHRLVVVASLPATFPTLGRVNPNMTEQAALTRVNEPRAANPYLMSRLALFEWAADGWVSKGEASLGFDKTNNNDENLHRVRSRAERGSTFPLFVWRARSVGARRPYRST